METIIIVAVSENDAIGKDNKLLFHLKEDMQNFKRLTTSNVVIMGRKTYESIGKPLKDRINIVVSRSDNKDEVNLIWVHSLEEAMKKAKEYEKDIYIIGGGSIYKEALIVDKIYLTRIKKRVNDADTFFPRLDYYDKWIVYYVESYNEGLLGYDVCEIRKRTKDF